jgi:hypothetical protein
VSINLEDWIKIKVSGEEANGKGFVRNLIIQQKINRAPFCPAYVF